MAKGNPNPSPATRFKPGCTGNPGGVTSEQKTRELRNAEKASELVEFMLDEALREIEDADTDARPAILKSNLNANFLKMVKDSQDRGFGAPKQVIDAKTSVSVTEIERVIVKAKD